MSKAKLSVPRLSILGLSWTNFDKIFFSSLFEVKHFFFHQLKRDIECSRNGHLTVVQYLHQQFGLGKQDAQALGNCALI